jgi:hypothetical protein
MVGISEGIISAEGAPFGKKENREFGLRPKLVDAAAVPRPRRQRDAAFTRR